MAYEATNHDASKTKTSFGALTLGALGVVYGDIGTSPLYAFKEAFTGAHPLPLTEANVLAVLSMIFWAVTLIVSLKYVWFVLKFDNAGEGGILALLALASRLTRENPRLTAIAAAFGIFGASLFYGDAIITPAISVLSAVEGLSVVAPSFEKWIVPITIGILIALFAIQGHGTAALGKLFGPVMLIWFSVLAVLGVLSIAQTPAVLAALDPRYAISFAVHSPILTFFVLGAVFLVMTGGEALYADMGHFGPRPIRLAWFSLVFPALMLNYLGQGALILRDPAAVKNPFYFLAPSGLLIPMVVLATLATVVAAQATISGAFSMTMQASRLGYLPRMPIRHTSETARGQIYLPQVNWTMLVLVVLLVLEFRTSSALAAAYGIAVSGTMLLTTSLVCIVLFSLSRRPNPVFLAVLGVIVCVEVLFLLSNAAKFADGGWFPILCGLALFTALSTWKRVKTLLSAHRRRHRVPIEDFPQLSSADFPRVPGTAVYLSPDPRSVPPALLHNLKHNKVLHERIVFLTVMDDDVPRLRDANRTWVEVIERGRVYQVQLRYGFMEEPDVPKGLKLLRQHGLQFEPSETTFFVDRSTIARAATRGLFTWRRELFRLMQRNSPSSAEYFKLMPDRVIELGTRVSI
jgi:KUP system potassium uptake protein